MNAKQNRNTLPAGQARGLLRPWLALFLALLLLLPASTGVAAQPLLRAKLPSAAGPVQKDQPITLEMKVPYAVGLAGGVELRLYQVAELSGYSNLRWTTAFAPYSGSLQLSGDNQSDWADLAETLAGLVERDGIKPTVSGRTGSQGIWQVGDGLTDGEDAASGISRKAFKLTPGIYLLLSDPVTIGEKTYTPQSILLTLPEQLDINTFQYAVQSVMKYSETEKPPETKRLRLKVMKAWHGDTAASRPRSIVVQLLQDGRLREEGTLSAANQWQYVFTDLPAGSRYRIVEKEVPAPYTVRVSQEGNVYTLHNSMTPPPPPETPPTEPGTPVPGIPDTGLDWWPVLILAALGLFLIFLGLLRRRYAERRQG